MEGIILSSPPDTLMANGGFTSAATLLSPLSPTHMDSNPITLNKPSPWIGRLLVIPPGTKGFKRESHSESPDEKSAVLRPEVDCDGDIDMAICTFYQRGNCRFGDQCKNEHPGSLRDANRNNGGGFGESSNSNRFGAFGGGDRYRPNQSGGTFGGGNSNKLQFSLDKADIKNDLTGQRPIYPLSSYGPGRDAPRQLIEGLVELSPEELRLRYYTQRNAGNEMAAQQEESALNEKMTQQVQAILNDIDGAVRYIEEGANIHPNRIDMAKGISSTANSAPASSNLNPFSQPSQPSSNPFSQPSSQASSNPFLKAPAATSTFGQASTPGFGKPAFGQAAAPSQSTSTASTFGQASAPGFGKPAFGQATAPNQSTSTTSAFGQASTPGFGKPAFGQAAAPSQSTPTTSAFGQASAPGFGRPAFGQTAAPNQPTSTFGQPANPSQPASGFGTGSAPGQKPSPFGQPSALGSGSAFGKPAFGSSGFGQPSMPGAGGQSNTFGKPAFGQSGTGQAPQLGAAASPFSQAAPQMQQPAAQQSAPATANGNVDPKDRYKEGKPEEYEGEQGKMLEEVYLRVSQTGRFLDDEDIPLVPPKCEWITPIILP